MIINCFEVESHADGAVVEFHRDGYKAYKTKLREGCWSVRAWK